MPKMDVITMGKYREPAVNLNFSVGKKGENGPADVMLIQTMFHYLCRDGKYAMTNVGFSPTQVPPISGRCCPKTQDAIVAFQRKNAHRLLQVDGKIEPAKYDNRSITPGEKRYMTMSLLHFLAVEMQLSRNDSSYADALCKIEPRLRPWLN